MKYHYSPDFWYPVDLSLFLSTGNILLPMDNSVQKDNQEQEQPESVLNIIRKEFFDLGGHDKDDDLRRSRLVGFLIL